MECFKEFYIHNFSFKNVAEFNENLFKEGISIYEVIRIERSIPLFLENHLNRLYTSSESSGFSIEESYCDFETLIGELLKKNQCSEGKIKLVVHFKNKTTKDVLIYFTPHYFPSIDEFKFGVRTGLCKATRKNPNIKILNTHARIRANHVIAEKKLFEVLLVDENGYITEGSRSNAFFVKDNMVITPPANQVLVGITRSNIIQICKKNQIPIQEKLVHTSDLTNMDALFLSGTSLKVLPVNSIDEIQIRSNNSLIQKISKLYDELINKYIEERLA